MADIVVLMKDGRIQQKGTPEELYSAPVNTFVAEFVGAPPMALIKGSALAGYDDELTIGIRAEKVAQAKPGKGRLQCTVTECEFPGAETFIGLDHEAAVGFTLMVPGLALRPAGQPVEITFRDEDLHVFDRSGKRALVTASA